MYGRGVPQDYAQSIQWYRRAAAQGNSSAQYALGVLYEDGKVISQDLVKAHMWLNLAASSLTGPAGKQAAEYRDRLIATMTQEQVVEAQALARQCKRQEFSECDELPSSVEKLATLPPAPTPAPSPTQEVIPLEFTNGIFVIPVVINEVIILKFVLDSGAADVSIPADVFLTLMRTGTIQTSDFMGEKPYEIADGSKVTSQTFRIRSLKVGDMVVQDVTGSVSSPGSKLLLGQSFLRRLKSWSMDNSGHALIIE
jgi:clan AA aspartic protease (TIGR02281 family)